MLDIFPFVVGHESDRRNWKTLPRSKFGLRRAKQGFARGYGEDRRPATAPQGASGRSEFWRKLRNAANGYGHPKRMQPKGAQFDDPG